MNTYSFRTIIEPDEGGTYHGYVPALRGCHTWGNSIEETRKRLAEAMEVFVLNLIDIGEKVPEEQGMEFMQTISIPSSINTHSYA